jgi:hypothetical protein
MKVPPAEIQTFSRVEHAWSVVAAGGLLAALESWYEDAEDDEAYITRIKFAASRDLLALTEELGELADGFIDLLVGHYLLTDGLGDVPVQIWANVQLEQKLGQLYLNLALAFIPGKVRIKELTNQLKQGSNLHQLLAEFPVLGAVLPIDITSFRQFDHEDLANAFWALCNQWLQQRAASSGT